MSTSAQVTLQVADWRRRVWSLYDEVRRVSVHDVPAGHQLWRAGRDDLFEHHPATPLLPAVRRAFHGLAIADYDAAWRFELAILDADPAEIEMSTGSDGDVPFERIGRAELPTGGSLDVWRLRTYGGGIFLPVRDGTAGREGGSYGGGRYLLDTIKGADLGVGADPQTLVLDFNFAYNPSCAYDPAWACPLAPLGNIVAEEISVGELYEPPPE